ncbi:cytochrome P450 [Ceratobasidium sp. AG-I]|nr:cytochrome P450 [Ceratobasidium sp. AG-I]
MKNQLEISVAVLLAGLGLIYLRRREKAQLLPLPPGPEGDFLLGNLRHIPKEEEWAAYAKMSEDCNSNVLGKTIVVLNSHRAVSDLLDKRAVYADRPQIQMINLSVMGLGEIVTFSQYGQRWRQLRKAIHQDMQESAISKYWPTHESEARWLVARLLDHGDTTLLKDIQHWAAASLLSGTYGYQLPPNTTSDPLLSNMEGLLSRVSIGTQSSRFLVNLFPSLKHIPEWMPGGSFQKFGRESRELKRLSVDVPFEWVKSEMRKGTAKPSYVTRMLSEVDGADSQATTEDRMVYEELTNTTLLSFFIAMQLYPDTQTRAREEVLRTIDPATHLPISEEVVKLDYLQRVLWETLRWVPALPLSLPHSAIEEDTYRGYRIPARSIMVANHWAITRDESLYPDPETFNPDRFLDPNLPYDLAFGHGRRRCPGAHFAHSNLLIAFAHILTVFDIQKARNEDGSVIEPVAMHRRELLSQPEHQRCLLVPRDEAISAELSADLKKQETEFA